MSDITKYPNGNGDIVGGSPGYIGDTDFYLCVDEVSADDVSTYVYWGTVNGNILYTIPSPNVLDGVTINYIRVYYRARDAGSYGAIVTKAAIKVGGNQYNVDSGHTCTATWTTWYYDYTVNPKTGVAWTVSDVNTPGNSNGLQQVGSYGNYIYNEGAFITDCTQIYVIINYTANAPTVTTQDVTDIAGTTATGHGNVTSDGGATITERGVCWIANSGTPTTANDKATSSGTTGVYAPAMTGLSAATHYHVRAYAINGIGTSYGSLVEFNTLGGGLLGIDGPGIAAGAAAWGFIS